MVFSGIIVRYFIDYEYGWIGVILLAYAGYKTGTMVWMPLSVQSGMTTAVFVYLGWLFHKHKIFDRPVSSIWLGGAAVIWLFGILFCGQFYIVRNYFGNGLFDILVAVAGSYVVIMICKVIERKTKSLARVLEFYGKNTLYILCMHAVELPAVSWKWVWELGERLELQAYQVTWIIIILKVLLFTVGIFIIYFIKDRYRNLKKWIKEKYEFGKKNEAKMEITKSAAGNRIEYMDMAKGIAITAMILGHAPIPDYLRMIIFSFHMPLFIIINGYFIKNYNIRRTFTRSVKTLLIPYAVVCLLSALIYGFIGAGSGNAGILFLSKIKAMFGGMSKISTRFLSFDSVWVVWFVCCLFLARNIYVILMRASEKFPVICPWGILVLAFLGYIIGGYYAFMPWSLDVALVSLIFIGTGNWMRKEVFFDKNYVYTLIIPAAVWIYFMRMGISIELAARSYPLGIFSIDRSYCRKYCDNFNC